MNSSFDTVEDRARHAAKGLKRVTSTLDIPPSPVGTNRRRGPAIALAAAAVVAVLVAVTVIVALRGGPSQNGIPALEPTPLPGGQRVSTAFQSGVSFEVPPPYQITVDREDETQVGFVGHSPSMPGVIWIDSVPWHSSGQARRVEDLIQAGDKRVRVLQQRPTAVDRVPATRVLLRVAPFEGRDLKWFCSGASGNSCITIERGLITAYVLEHDGRIVVIGDTTANLRADAMFGRVVDGVAATWRWAEQ